MTNASINKLYILAISVFIFKKFLSAVKQIKIEVKKNFFFYKMARHFTQYFILPRASLPPKKKQKDK